MSRKVDPRHRSPAPCWWCSRKLFGGRGIPIKVDGNTVYVHRVCGEKLAEDEDFRNRVDHAD